MTFQEMIHEHEFYISCSGCWGSAADFSEMDLSLENLSNHDLRYSVLKNVILPPEEFLPRVEVIPLAGFKDNLWPLLNPRRISPIEKRARTNPLPKTGSCKGYKKVFKGLILELMIPEDALRIQTIATSACRASAVYTVGVHGRKKQTPGEVFYSMNGSEFEYVVGKVSEASSFNHDVRTTDAPGIHFFMKPEEANNFVL